LIVAVDARHLAGGRGVAHHTRGLLGALAARFPDDEWRAIVPGRAPVDAPPGVDVRRTALPSRAVFGAAAVTGRPRLDRLAAGSGWPRLDRPAAASPPRRSAPAPEVVWLPAPAPVAVSRDVPYVLTVHDLSWLARPRDFTPYERLWHRLARIDRLARRAAAVVASSAATRDAMLRAWALPPERVHVVHLGVTPAGDAAPAPRALPARFVLAVGALEPRKAPELLVAAHRLARARGLDADLVFAGAGRLAPRLRGDGVHVLGHVADLAPLYANALGLAMPSHLEGFGFPPLEAALHGTPSVLSDLPVFGETLGDAALRVADHTPEAWADALLRIAADDTLRTELGARARRAAARFTWDAAADRLHPILVRAAA
jgi:glycosyltransferase involved in cell wall biosynthesis